MPRIGTLTGVTEDDEESLLDAARQGDRDAQSTLFTRHRERVARQVLRMTGEPGSVDDLVQEVFIAAFSALGRFRGEARIETWLYTITANKVPGIRAAVVSDCFSATMAREHNNANILCLGQRVLGDELAKMLALSFLRAEFAGGRHARRVAKIDAAGGS